MDNHFRGFQPPTSHIIPGAPGAPGHPPHPGFIEPPFIIPAVLLADIVTEIRREFATQNRFVTNQYSNLKQDYNDMKEDFKLCIHQTDRILTEQYARFEVRLEGIQKGLDKFQKSQTAAITDLGARLDALEGLTEASRDALSSKITTIVETMGHGFEGLVTMIKNNEYAVPDPFSLKSGIPAYSASPEAFPSSSKLPDGPSYAGNAGYESGPDDMYGVEETLVPATLPQTDLEVDTGTALVIVDPPLRGAQPAELPPVAVLSNIQSPASSGDNPGSEEQDQLCEGDTPTVPTPAAEELLDPPAMDTGDITTVPASPPTIPPEGIVTTPATDHDPPQTPLLQVSLFDTPSPLTPITTTSSQNRDEPQMPAASPEIRISTPQSTSAGTASRKRKRTSYGRASKTSRRNRKSRPQENRGDVPSLIGQSDGTHADPSIWPPVIEDGATSQRYVECDRCAKWFHFGCVGLQGAHEDGSPWKCPLCVRDPTRDAYGTRETEEMCSRPGCSYSDGQEFFMDRLLGRCYVPDQGVIKYLVSYDMYGLDQCTWEPPESFSNDLSKIKEFLEWWATENPSVDVESLDHRDTIYLGDAYALARMGFTWPGA